MGRWLNVAFVETGDLAAVEEALVEAFVEAGRPRIRPSHRTPERFDPMQYGRAGEVDRWGAAAFPGAPGWTAVLTAPLELLSLAEPPPLAALAARLGACAFQYDLFDGDSHVLTEASPDGRVERSGFQASEPLKHWGPSIPDDRLSVRFRLVAVEAAAERARWSQRRARVEGLMPAFHPPHGQPRDPGTEVGRMLVEMEERTRTRRHALTTWLERVGGTMRGDLWSAHPADVVRCLADEGDAFLPIEGCVDDAIRVVFGGAHASACDNQVTIGSLIPHKPLPVAGAVVYGERTRDRA